MFKGLISTTLFTCVVAALAPAARGATIHVQFFPLTGEVRLQNRQSSDFNFIYYSLSSASGALDGSPGVWKSITDTYDAPSGATPGNGFVDPDYEWTKLTPGAGVGATELTEAVFLGPGGTLEPYRTVSLGQIWDTDAAPMFDIEAEFVQADEQPATVEFDFAVVGDYNSDDTVNALDYQTWKFCYGMSLSMCNQISGGIYFPDGNLDGVIGPADYTIWRNNLGRSVPPVTAFSATSSPAGVSTAPTAVPEPSAALLLLVGAVLFMFSFQMRFGR